MQVTNSVDEARKFYIDDLDLTKPFPLSWLWIAASNDLVDEVNNYFHRIRKEKLSEENKFGKIFAQTEIEKQLENESLFFEHQFDFVNYLKSPQLPDPEIDLLYGEPLTILHQSFLSDEDDTNNDEFKFILPSFEEILTIQSLPTEEFPEWKEGNYKITPLTNYSLCCYANSVFQIFYYIIEVEANIDVSKELFANKTIYKSLC